ncbi:MAG TPA: hypothetical protein VLT82_00690 [Myxococcaceae bacterium]|nr:hypothetical protein [Myxococcaceae bacterium]
MVLANMGAIGSSLAAEMPADGCNILKTAEIQALAGGAKVSAVASTDALGSRHCQYTWGTGGNVHAGRSSINVSVTETSKAFPGTDLETLKESLLARVKMAHAPAVAGVINGVGDAATWASDDPIRVEATAFVKGKVLTVTFESKDARAQKDQVSALLKAAAGRL